MQAKEYFDLINPKYIDWSFYSKYIDREPPFGELGLIVYFRTYSRFIEQLQRREYWRETCLRVVEYSLSLDTVSSDEWKKDEAENLFDVMFNLKGFPAGRSLWTAGTKQTEVDSSCNWNCTLRIINDISSFSEIFYWLLIGAGTGFSVEEKYISQLPKFNFIPVTHQEYEPYDSKLRDYNTEIEYKDNRYISITLTKEKLTLPDYEYSILLKELKDKVVIVVGDSKEGWCNALRAYLHILSLNLPITEIVFNYDNVRPEGERIKTFGGRSSGHGVLIELFDRIAEIVKESNNGVLSSIDVLDIINMIGLGVVSGGTRRCLPKGTFIHLKDGLRKIEDVKKGDLVATSKGYHEVTDWVYQGVQNITEIKTQLGKFECTAKHKIAVISDTKGSYIWKTAEELVVGDRMVFVKNTIDGQQTKLPSFKYDKPKNSTRCKDIIIPEFTEDIAYLLGYCHGNGYVRCTETSGQISFAIYADHVKILNKLTKTIELFGVSYSIQEPSIEENCFKLNIKSKQLALYFSLFKQANIPLNIPLEVLNGSENIRINYIAGLSDADGCYKNRPYIIVNSVYPDFVKQIQCLVATLGIPTCLKSKRQNHEKWQDTFELSLKGVSAINDFKKKIAPYVLKFEDFHGNTKSKNDFGFPKDGVKYKSSWCSDSAQMTVSRLESCTGKEVMLIPIEVLEINHDARSDLTYDISVNSVNEFICDAGYLVHNTAQIALGNSTDKAFKEAKVDLWTDPKKEKVRRTRVMSNNSILNYEKLSFEDIQETFECLKSQGDPGFWNIGNANKISESPILGTNPCSEAALDNKQSCNLTTLVPIKCVYFCSKDKRYKIDWFELENVINLITRVGSRQTTAKQWHPDWDATQKRDRLLGVSMTGIQDLFDLLEYNTNDKIYFYNFVKKVAIETANEYHDNLGINRSTRVTLLKPEGTISQLPTVSSGVHKAYAPYYFRRVRFSKSDPLSRVLLDCGLEPKPENSQGDNLYADICNTWVFTLPIKTKAKVRAIDIPAIEQLEEYKLAQKYYADRGHNVSFTCTLSPEEYDIAAKWVYDNWDDIIGVSFLPKYDPQLNNNIFISLINTLLGKVNKPAYPQLPYETCTKKQYYELKKTIPVLTEEKVIELLKKYENEYEEQELDSDCNSKGFCPVR